MQYFHFPLFELTVLYACCLTLPTFPVLEELTP